LGVVGASLVLLLLASLAHGLTPELVAALGLACAGAVFAVGLQHNHPIPVLAGRRVVASYPAWVWSHGLSAEQRERDLRAVFALAPAATDLLAAYGVDYVVVGPNEREQLGADPAAFEARYPRVLRTATYQVFAVRSAGAVK